MDHMLKMLNLDCGGSLVKFKYHKSQNKQGKKKDETTHRGIRLWRKIERRTEVQVLHNNCLSSQA